MTQVYYARQICKCNGKIDHESIECISVTEDIARREIQKRMKDLDDNIFYGSPISKYSYHDAGDFYHSIFKYNDGTELEYTWRIWDQPLIES